MNKQLIRGACVFVVDDSMSIVCLLSFQPGGVCVCVCVCVCVWLIVVG